MALLINHIYRSLTICQLGFQSAYLNRYWKLTNLAGTFTEQDFADKLSADLAPLYKPLLCNDATYNGTAIQLVDTPAPHPRMTVSISGAGAGTAGVGTLPKQTAGVLSLYGALADRTNQGRQYIPFPSSASSTADGVPTVGYQGAAALLAAYLASPVTLTGLAGSIDLSPVIYNPTVGVAVPIVDRLVRAAWGTQRKRGDFGATNLPPF